MAGGSGVASSQAEREQNLEELVVKRSKVETGRPVQEDTGDKKKSKKASKDRPMSGGYRVLPHPECHVQERTAVMVLHGDATHKLIAIPDESGRAGRICLVKVKVKVLLQTAIRQQGLKTTANLPAANGAVGKKNARQEWAVPMGRRTAGKAREYVHAKDSQL
ncbi:unnamed protein product [Mytilus coruscus]|uniref:Uncharacterized protein n=1 Tax=Mytilus coruscus TaxID=42192 RepID=A0A6J8C7I8_MYTCO|nr:unnamed protein product [Mytilus coruscus]